MLEELSLLEAGSALSELLGLEGKRLSIAALLTCRSLPELLRLEARSTLSELWGLEARSTLSELLGWGPRKWSERWRLVEGLSIAALLACRELSESGWCLTHLCDVI